MSNMKWTKQQEEAISLRGRDVLVSAAAGSGKTAVLTERIKQLILQDGISIDEMLIMTFSNAAASEMKEKIIKSLTEEAERDSERAAFLRKQIRYARTAEISTFHKFSMGVIRRYFYLTDVEPDFAVCVDASRETMIEESLDELVEERFENDTERFTTFLTDYADVRSENRIRELIRAVYRFIMSMPDSFEWLAEKIEKLKSSREEFCGSPVYHAMKRSLQADLQYMYNLAEEVYDDVSDLKSIEPKAASDLSQIAKLYKKQAAASSDDYIEQITEGTKELEFAVYRASKEDKEAYEEIKDLTTHKRNMIKNTVKKINAEFASLSLDSAIKRIQATYEPAKYLYDLVLDFNERFMAKKAENNMLDFNDIEHVALEILRHDEISDEYRRRYKAVFVDEYQDSSILQETLLERVGSGKNVYMVGDVKQSIYKFRLAEPEIFIGKYNDFRSGRRDGIRIDLNKNFRSKAPILEAVNGVFRNVMNTDTCGIEYDEDAALKKGVSYSGELEKPVSMHLVDTVVDEEIAESEPELAEMKSIELEALITAEQVASCIGKNIYDCKRESVRKIVPGDVAILMRGTRGRADIFAEALKEQGIQSFVDSGEGYFETNEIEVFINLLIVIDNKRKDIPLLSVLHSMIFGFSTDELIDIRLAFPKCDYSEAFINYAGNAGSQPHGDDQSASAEESASDDQSTGLKPELRDKCALACEKLSRWRTNARFMPLDDFLQELMLETGYLNYVNALPGGNVRAANMRALVDKSIEYASSQSGGLFGFITYIQSAGKSNVSIGQAVGAGDTENAVKIMTIHKSKGLEFPVVILANIARRFNRDSNSLGVSMHRELGFSMQYSDNERHCHATTIAQRVIEKQKLQEQIAEEMRILYVAMTRPQDKLIIVGAIKKLPEQLEKYRMGIKGGIESANSFADWIIPNMEAANIELTCHSRESIIDAEEEFQRRQILMNEDIKAGFPQYTDESKLMSVLSERFEFSYPYADDVTSKSKFSVSELNKVLQRSPEKTLEYRESQNAGKYYEIEEIPEQKKQQKTPEATALIPQFLQTETKISPLQKGTIAHTVMQLIPFVSGTNEDTIKGFVKELVEKNVMSEHEASVVPADKLAGFFKSEIGQRACKAEFLKKEWAFTLRKNRFDLMEMAESKWVKSELEQMLPQEVLIQGVIDCCFKDEDGIVIIDYKTDRVDINNRENEFERMKKNYRHQIELYRNVIETAMDEKVSQSALFLFDTADMIEI